jgi:hypothetical protein
VNKDRFCILGCKQVLFPCSIGLKQVAAMCMAMILVCCHGRLPGKFENPLTQNVARGIKKHAECFL